MNKRIDAPQRGSAVIMMMTLVGLMGLVAGAAMLSTGDTLLETAKQGDESMQASTLGSGRGVFNDALEAPSSLVPKDSQAASNASASHASASHASASHASASHASASHASASHASASGASASGATKGFFEALGNVAWNYVTFTPSSLEETAVYGENTLSTIWNGAASAVEDVWDLGVASTDYVLDEDYRAQQNGKLVRVVGEVLSNPAEAVDTLVTVVSELADQIDGVVHEADRIVDYGSAIEKAELYGQVSGGLVTTVLGAVSGGAIAKVAKVSKISPATAVVRSEVLPAKKKAPSPIRPLISSDLRQSIDELETLGDSFVIPKGTNKDGLLAYLSSKDVEHAVVRTNSGELRVILGDDNNVQLSPHDPKRLIFHNHPGEAGPFISGNNTLALTHGQGDLAVLRQGFPRQRSTIIGTADGTYRNRVPTTADLERDVAPPLKGSIIGGTGPTDTPIIRKQTGRQNSLNQGMNGSEMKPDVKALGAGRAEKTIAGNTPRLEARLAVSAQGLPAVKWKQQSQDAHTPGTAANINRKKQGKVTSEFFGEESGRHATLIALERGKPVLNRKGDPIAGVVEYDFGAAIGTGPNGGVFTKVKAKTDSRGRVHGHPSGQEMMVGRDKKLVPWRQALKETQIRPIFELR